MNAPVLGVLPAGPVDIVGDVHGEIEGLAELIERLGYDLDGKHPRGRRLVFVGDLVDRGPDSPGVVARVMRYVRLGGAQCILGNHEINLLRGARREGNAWFAAPNTPPLHPSTAAGPQQRQEIVRFLATLPLALARSDLRIVHACWDGAAIEQIMRGGFATIAEAYLYFEAAVREDCERTGLDARCRREADSLSSTLGDAQTRPRLLPAHAELDMLYQMRNPVRVLTSGPEAPASAPFWASGRWRMVERVKWWENYDDQTPVVIGHYWRRYAKTQTLVGDKDAADVFAGIEPYQWMGRRSNVYCVDFSVGGRPAERMRGGAAPFICKLAALRVPEWQVVHDDGEAWDIGPPG